MNTFFLFLLIPTWIHVEPRDYSDLFKQADLVCIINEIENNETGKYEALMEGINFPEVKAKAKVLSVLKGNEVKEVSFIYYRQPSLDEIRIKQPNVNRIHIINYATSAGRRYTAISYFLRGTFLVYLKKAGNEWELVTPRSNALDSVVRIREKQMGI